MGNGHDIFLWLENWHPLGPLFQKFEAQLLNNVGRFLLAKADTIIDQGVWRWPRSRSLVTREIINHTSSFFVPITNQNDSVIWTLHPSGCFTSVCLECVREEIYNRLQWLERREQCEIAKCKGNISQDEYGSSRD